MKIALYGKPFTKENNDQIGKLFKKLDGHEIIVHNEFLDFLSRAANLRIPAARTFSKWTDIKDDTNFFFSIGGDGTFLESVTYVRNSGIPIAGINIGRLGFLANIPVNDALVAIKAILNNQFVIEERSLVKLVSPKKLFGDADFSLNEISVQKNQSSSMITVHAYVDGEFLNSYWADGLIIASPTGSTAYSLSVGGPIVVPGSQNFIITPIAPHNLAVRPIVIPDKATIKLKIESRSGNFILSLDHRSVICENSIEMTIKKAAFKIKMLKLDNQAFFGTLRNKLMWGMDKRN